MGTRDARDQLEAAKAEMVRLETENAELRAANAELTEAERQWEQFSNAYSRAERAEAVIAEALGVARASSVPLGMPEAAFYASIKREVEFILAAYSNGADHDD